MVASKPSKILYAAIFLLPALLLYSLFFITPLAQGIQYSLTDWNGIVPEIPLTMGRSDFQNQVIAKLSRSKDLAYLLKYYHPDETGETYRLTTWIDADDGARQINTAEKRRLKRILKSIGISSIKYIGLQNYRDMFQKDQRFVPRLQKKYLFNEFEDLPTTISAKVFHKNLLAHIASPDARELVLNYYRPDAKHSAYLLAPQIATGDADRLKFILAQHLYENSFIPGVIGFTLFFTLINVAFSNLLALILALILDTKMKTRNFLRSVFFLPNVLSLIIVAFIWSFIFRLILPQLTGISVWLGSPELAPYAVLMVTIWQSCGYLMIIYLAGLQTIPAEITEVAEIDGANRLQRLYRVTLPLLLPAMTICLFYSLANSLKTFDVILALTSGGPGYVTTPIVLDIYFNAFNNNQFGYATAKAVLLCVVIMLITGIQLFLMKKKEVEL